MQIIQKASKRTPIICKMQSIIERNIRHISKKCIVHSATKTSMKFVFQNRRSNENCHQNIYQRILYTKVLEMSGKRFICINIFKNITRVMNMFARVPDLSYFSPLKTLMTGLERALSFQMIRELLQQISNHY